MPGSHCFGLTMSLWGESVSALLTSPGQSGRLLLQEQARRCAISTLFGAYIAWRRSGMFELELALVSFTNFTVHYESLQLCHSIGELIFSRNVCELLCWSHLISFLIYVTSLIEDHFHRRVKVMCTCGSHPSHPWKRNESPWLCKGMLKASSMLTIVKLEIYLTCMIPLKL